MLYPIRRQQDMKDNMLSALLTQDARARRMWGFFYFCPISFASDPLITSFLWAVGRIAAVKPDKAKQIEDMLIRLAQQGQIQPKLDEQALIGVLDKISEMNQKPAVKVRIAQRNSTTPYSLVLLLQAILSSIASSCWCSIFPHSFLRCACMNADIKRHAFGQTLHSMFNLQITRRRVMDSDSEGDDDWS